MKCIRLHRLVFFAIIPSLIIATSFGCTPVREPRPRPVADVPAPDPPESPLPLLAERATPGSREARIPSLESVPPVSGGNERESHLETADTPAAEPTGPSSGVSRPPRSASFITRSAEERGRKFAFAGTPPADQGKESGDSGEDLVFNFDNADLYEVIRTLANLLEINYIVDPNVRGRVTIHTAGKLSRSDLFPIFNQILEANGLAAVREGKVYKIGPLKEAPRSRIATRYGRRFRGKSEGERVIMQIVPLEYISASEMTKLLTPFLSAEGTIISHDESNTLLIVDRDVGIRKALELVNVFDVNLFEDVQHRFFELDYLDVKEMADLLTDILASYGPLEEEGMKIIPIERLNMLLMMGRDAAVFGKAESFIRRLDVPTADVTPKIFVYYVKNGNAEELADLLNAVFGEGTEATSAAEAAGAAGSAERNPFAPPDPFDDQGDAAPARPGSESEAPAPPEGSGRQRTPLSGGTGTLGGEVRITPDPSRNALIIESSPSDYRIVETILEKLDILPRQVLIEVVIAEISLDGSEDFGVEWEYRRGEGGSVDLSLLSGRMGSAGLQYTVGETNRWSAAFSALATKNKVNILSAPVVLASDNKEAKINVSDKIPVASAEYIFNSGSEGVTQTNIQYRDTGIILTVTPHINERGLVTMDISQEVSEQGDGVNVGGESFPSFRERSVNTSLTVKHGQTLVMGGLMRERDTRGKSGVPFFSRLPVIGFLFGQDSEEYAKTELILLITPRVIVSLDDIDAVTEEFKEKVKQARAQQRTAETQLFRDQ